VDGKRVPGPRWDDVVTVPDPAGGEPIPVNRYFAEHPEQVLGTIDRTGTMYRGEAASVSKTEDYERRLQDAISRLPEGVLKRDAAPPERFSPEAMPEPGDTKEGGYAVKGGKLYVRDGGSMEAVEADKKTLERISAHLELRDAVRAVLNDQLAGTRTPVGGS
jgi:N12 class adenine-specific DNA methylase